MGGEWVTVQKKALGKREEEEEDEVEGGRGGPQMKAKEANQ